jgi:hypothetical protein
MDRAEDNVHRQEGWQVAASSVQFSVAANAPIRSAKARWSSR